MIEYTYKGRQVEILSMDLDEGGYSDPQDFVPYAEIRFRDNGETKIVHCASIHPDPELVLLGLPQMITKMCDDCRVYSEAPENEKLICRSCGKELTSK